MMVLHPQSAIKYVSHQKLKISNCKTNTFYATLIILQEVRFTIFGISLDFQEIQKLRLLMKLCKTLTFQD